MTPAGLCLAHRHYANALVVEAELPPLPPRGNAHARLA